MCVCVGMSSNLKSIQTTKEAAGDLFLNGRAQSQRLHTMASPSQAGKGWAEMVRVNPHAPTGLSTVETTPGRRIKPKAKN